VSPGYLIDTNILIYYLNGQLTQTGKRWMMDVLVERTCLSIISRIEILGWKGHTDASLKATEGLLSKLTEQTLNDPIATLCIGLRRNHPIKLPDAIIAATALHLDLPLITRNVTDFRTVERLRLINPFEL